jgi:uncharacterized protein
MEPQKTMTLPRTSLLWLIVLIGLAIAYSPTYITRVLRSLGVQYESQGPPSVILWNWLVVGLLVAFVFFIEKRDLASLRLDRPSWQDLEWAFIFWGIATASTGLFAWLFPPPPSQGLSTLQAIPIPLLIALIFTTATTEDILYRAYPIERLQEVTHSAWLAVTFSFVLFVLPHIAFFGWYWLVSNGVSVVLAYLLFVWRRNLWANMLMHLLGNALILLPALGLVGRA